MSQKAGRYTSIGFLLFLLNYNDDNFDVITAPSAFK
jgi:hypothetical protein